MEKEPYELCDHEYTIKKHGLRICLTCGLEMREIRHVHEEGYEDRIFTKNTGPDHIVEIRKKMRELMSMVVNGPHNFIYPDSKNTLITKGLNYLMSFAST